MARDYKYRAQSRKSRGKSQSSVAGWKWFLIILLLSIFIAFLNFIGDSETNTNKKTKTLPHRTKVTQKTIKQNKKIKHSEREQPKFDFYTILPESEVAVPDHEIKTRTREERVGKAKKTSYIMQAGSFREFKEADKLRARLALMGIESRIERAKVGNVVWNRIKIGPYSRMSSVDQIKSRLKQNGIDAMVTEVGG